MIAALKAEFLKLLTVRSTYILTGLVIVGVALLSFFVFGGDQQARTMEDADLLQGGVVPNPDLLYEAVYNSLGLFATFGAIIAILLVTHEYRYNMITYTLTSINRRIKVLAAKSVVMVAYGIVAGLIVAVVGYFGTKLGVAAKGLELVPQELELATAIWQFGSYVLATILVGLIIGLLIRSVVGAIVVFFLMPIAEQLLSLLLKENAKYLPTQAVEGIVSTGQVALMGGQPLSHVAALGVVAIYLVIFGTLATVLFIRRDAA